MRRLRLLTRLLLPLATFGQSATINWTDQHQQIDGFGGGSMGLMSVMSPTTLDFFYTTSGIGLTILPTAIFPSVAQSQITHATVLMIVCPMRWRRRVWRKALQTFAG